MTLHSSARRAALLLVAAAAPAVAQAPASDPLLQRLLDYPHPSALVGAPGARGRVAWVVNDRGERSVWALDPAIGRAQRLARWPGDDGQDLTGLSLSTDGQVVAFVRGQGGNRRREHPNPTSDPAGAEQAVWVSVRGAPARRVAAGTNATVTPDGAAVVFQRDSTLYIAPTASGTAAAPLFRGRGVNTDPRWSPDGRRVAFTSNRGTHSLVGVYDRATRRITWLDPSIERDNSPRWSPDGRRVAFLRAFGGGPAGDFIRAVPAPGFAVMLADVATGGAHERWRSPAGPAGRVRVPTAGEHFLWTGAHLVFVAEFDGWQHLHALEADGTVAPRQMTAGTCEVEEPVAAADGAAVYVSSNCDDLHRKHLWRVPLTGGPPERVTGGPLPSSTIEWAPALAGGAVTYLRADATHPPHLRIRDLATGEDRGPAGAPALPADWPVAAQVTPEPVRFESADGFLVHGQLFVPRGATAAHPAAIFLHGGPSRQMLLGWNKSHYYSRHYALAQALAARGVVVLSVNYRLGIGYGRVFREAARGGRYGASEYQDVVAGARFLQRHPAVDARRIALWGGSYGGYLTAYGMVKDPDLFTAGFDIHGVHDWNADFAAFAPATVAGRRESDSVLAIGRASSPICCVDALRGPLLLVHGDDDRNVQFSETVDFAQLLRRAGKPFDLLVFPDEVHDFLRHASWTRTQQAGLAFLLRALGRDAPATGR
jgi:dipeptidyl aminopeptidase/acylaminoacyl peptidase